MEEDHGFNSAASVKRKPLLRDSRHSRTISSSSFEGDAFPLVPVDNRFSWSPPPDIHDTDTSYEASKHLDQPQPAQLQDDGRRQFFSKSSQYSKLTPNFNQEDDPVPVQKTPLAYQNAIPDEQDSSVRPQMWNPIWLHTLVLCGFILLFLALIAGLIILWHFAELENGISTDITDNHYAWTYGPTALLVLIEVAWRQVDFFCRVLAPWSHLQHGSAPARNSLLLDYISPALPKALVAATANHEWAVVASCLGILLLRIVIVFSTGLLVLTPTPVSRTINNTIVNSKFVGTNYTTGPSAIDTELMRYYGVQEQGMSYQYGTTGTVAYDTIDLQSVLPNSTITTMVNGVFPFFNCEIVEPQIVGDNFTWTTDTEYPYNDVLNLTLTLTPAGCPPLRSYYELCQTSETGCPSGQYIASEELWNSPDSYNPFKPLDDLDPCANLYQLTVIKIFYERIPGQPINSSAGWNVTMPQAVGIVCPLGYTIDTVNVTIDVADPTNAGGVNTTGPLNRIADVLPGFSYYNLTEDFQNEVFTSDLPHLPDAPYIYGFAKLFAVMNGGFANTLLNATLLKITAEKAFKGVAVQMAHKFLRKSNNKTVAAKAFYQEQRLQVRMVSVWAMGVGLLFLALSGGAVLVWRPRHAVARNPNSIARHATVLAASPALQRSLEGSGSDTNIHLKERLAGTIATSVIRDTNGYKQFSIETDASDEIQSSLLAGAYRNAPWWRPMSIAVWFMALAVVLPVGIIIALEVLQRESDAHNGLIDVSATSIIDHSMPSILASLFMISMAMTYDAINFAAATLAPYQALTRASVAAKRTLLGASLGDLPLWSTFEAIRNRHGSAAMTSVAAIFGSLLTIISSGLYTIENVPFASSVSILTSDKFVPSFSTSSDGGAGAMFALIEHSNASYPALTYDELVFPRMVLSSLGTDAIIRLGESEEVVLQASIPAVRASLNCNVVPRDTMVRTNTYEPTAHVDTSCPDSTVAFNTSLPESCPHFLDQYNKIATEIQFSYDVQHDCETPDSSSEGTRIYMGANLPSVNGVYLGDEGTTLGAASNPPGCPSLAFIYGYWVLNSTSTENITAMTCIQGFEQVYTNTTFVVSKDSIQVRSPPIVDENSAQWLSSFNSTYWFTKYGEFDAFNQDGTTPDFFYQQVNDGPDGIPPNELTGPENTDRFVNATQHVYRKFMAQMINSNMRQDLNSTEAASSPQYKGTVSDKNVLRLKQNATSTLILQIFLAVMLACGVFVYSRRNMRHVLPHSPWSIAGTMSLLAGSEMLERKIIPAGAEFMSDEELAKVFEGYMFSLGWWDAGGKTTDLREKRRFGIDIGKADTSAGKAGVVQ